MKRDFTATCFVLEESEILLIFHKKFQKWLPPGGHLDPNELPHEAAIREVKEETGLDVTLVDDTPFPFSYPNAKTIPRPFFMALEDVPAYKDTAAHQHIDFFFLAHPVSGTTTWNENETDAIQWFSEEELLAIPKGEIFEDTREVGLAILRQQCHIMQST